MNDGIGRRLATDVLTQELGDALGWDAQFDIRVLAETVVARIELEVVKQLDVMKQSYQAALVASMEYMRQVNVETDGKVNLLRSTNETLTRKLAKVASR